MHTPVRPATKSFEALLRSDTGREALVAFARADFWCFIELMFPVLHPGKDLVYAPYRDGIDASRGRQIPAGHHQFAAAAHEIHPDVGPLSGLASRA